MALMALLYRSRTPGRFHGGPLGSHLRVQAANACILGARHQAMAPSKRRCVTATPMIFAIHLTQAATGQEGYAYSYSFEREHAAVRSRMRT